MQSMTGYGFNEGVFDRFKINVEIKSLNTRFLEIYIDSPSYLNSYDLTIQKMISASVKRGKVQVKIYIVELEADMEVHLDAHLAKKFYHAFQNLKTAFTLNDDVNISHFLGTDGVFQIDSKRDVEQIWQNLEPVLEASLGQLMDAKANEGLSTQENLLFLGDAIRSDLEAIKGLTPKNVENAVVKLKTRLAELLSAQFDEQRILTEVAIMASKIDINEEVERLSYHIQQFTDTCQLNEAVGKKLDFISQEMHREINTIGSKSNDLLISNRVIEMKSNLEKIKEQIRNIE